jgi:hypothetical protein
MHPLTKPIPIYNIDGTANDASAITDIADVILCYKNHSEHTQLAVTHLGKQCNVQLEELKTSVMRRYISR